jgi:Rod binding domain-containing protein
MSNLSIPSSPLRSADADELKARFKLDGELQRAQGMRKLPGNINPAKLKETAQDFEATFLSQMLGHMFAGIETDPLFGGGEAEDIYRSMMVDEYGKLIAKAGGIGIADHVVRQFIQDQEVPSAPVAKAQETTVKGDDDGHVHAAG